MALFRNGFSCVKNNIRLFPQLQSVLQNSPITQRHCRFYHFLYSSTRQGNLLQSSSKFQSSKWCLQRTFQTKRNGNRPTQILKQSDKQTPPGLLKPFIFTIAISGASFTVAMIWAYENLRDHAKRIVNWSDRQQNLHEQMGKTYGIRAQMNSLWTSLSSGEKMIVGVIAANVAVFGLWRVKSLSPFMLRYFSCAPGSPVSSLVLCSFSHYGTFHLICNMYVLWSFSSAAIQLMGKEQMAAFFVSAAAFSSLTSLVYKTLKLRSLPSLGASGAIMAMLGAVCLSFPDSKLSIAFVSEIYPHSFSASHAVVGIIALDLAGVLLGWRLFDHAAHLGGMLFGILYVKYGRDLIWGNREPVMQMWHKIRSSV